MFSDTQIREVFHFCFLERLLKLSDSGISSPVYALKGMLRYDDVQGEAYLQLDSRFGEQAEGESPLCEKLSLSLYLPGSGTVSVRDVGLYQYASGEDPLQAGGQWFSSRNAGLFGGIASLVGGAVARAMAQPYKECSRWMPER